MIKKTRVIRCREYLNVIECVHHNVKFFEELNVELRLLDITRHSFYIDKRVKLFDCLSCHLCLETRHRKSITKNISY